MNTPKRRSTNRPNPRRRQAERVAIPKPAPEPPSPSPIPVMECEADVADGLTGLAWRELKARFGDRIERAEMGARDSSLRFVYVGNPFQLLSLRTVQAVYTVRHYPVPRPKALLGDQHFKRMLADIAAARDLAPTESFRTLTISAAGSDSSVMMRLKDELTTRTGLEATEEEGDLLLRVRRPLIGEGWEVLTRLSPRPLATRAWRVCNREGALNAAVAAAMAMLTMPMPEDHVLNLMCGSGTLLIERLAAETCASAIGYDIDPTALDCAAQNVMAAGFADHIKLRQGDIRDLPHPARSADVICADLPFGNLVGSHEGNVALYPVLLQEAARVAKPGARAAFITGEVRLMDGLLDGSPLWSTDQVIRVGLGGLHPRLYLLSRKE